MLRIYVLYKKIFNPIYFFQYPKHFLLYLFLLFVWCQSSIVCVCYFRSVIRNIIFYVVFPFSSFLLYIVSSCSWIIFTIGVMNLYRAFFIVVLLLLSLCRNFLHYAKLNFHCVFFLYKCVPKPAVSFNISVLHNSLPIIYLLNEMDSIMLIKKIDTSWQ